MPGAAPQGWPEPASAPATRSALPRLRVLIVEDDRPTRELLGVQLLELGHEAVAVESADQALARLRAAAFDVLLTDCRMAGMDGLALARAVRAEAAEAPARLRIIGLTASNDAADIDAALQSGMDVCLVKPLTPEALGRALLAQPDPAEAAAPDTAWLGRFSRTARVRFLRAWRESNLADRQALDAALAGDRTEDIARLAHKIRGPAQIAGCHEIEAAAANLELLCRAQSPVRALVRRRGMWLGISLEQLNSRIDSLLAEIDLAER